MQRRQYEDRDGIKLTSFDVVADEIEFLTPKARTDNREDPPESALDLQPVDRPEDLPF